MNKSSVILEEEISTLSKEVAVTKELKADKEKMQGQLNSKDQALKAEEKKVEQLKAKLDKLG